MRALVLFYVWVLPQPFTNSLQKHEKWHEHSSLASCILRFLNLEPQLPSFDLEVALTTSVLDFTDPRNTLRSKMNFISSQICLLCVPPS